VISDEYNCSECGCELTDEEQTYGICAQCEAILDETGLDVTEEEPDDGN